MYSPQLQQNINLFILVLLGISSANFHLAISSILIIILYSILIEHILIYFKKKAIRHFSFSSISTAIGVMLMTITPHLWITLLLISLGLFQKHFLVWKGRHFFNPSNFALMMGLIFFYHDAHIALGQLGDSIYLIGLSIILGISILYRVDRWVIPVVFILSYLLFQYFFVVKGDPIVTMEDVEYRFYSVSFIVFILFMLTDPRTTPSKKKWQFLFAFAIAFSSSLLDYIHGFRVQHLFMALFFLSPVVIFGNYYQEIRESKNLILLSVLTILLSLGSIIYIENLPPYYYEMES